MDEERKRQEYEEEEKFKDRQFMKTFVPTGNKDLPLFGKRIF